jgi:hypothetical protein
MPDRIQHNPTDLHPSMGPLDELAFTGCDVHLEQMSDQLFSLVISRGAETLHVSLYAPGRGRIHARVDSRDGFEGAAR